MPDILVFKHSIKLFEGMAALAGFVYWKKWKTGYWKWFPVYLLALFLSECLGNVFAAYDLRTANSALYRFWVLPVEFLFYCWFYYKSFERKWKPLALGCSVLFVFSWFVEFFMVTQRSEYFSSLSYSVGNVVMVVLTVSFMLGRLFSEAILDYKSDPMFWITIALMIFYLGTFPYYGLFNLLVLKYRHLHELYTWAMIVMNYTLYLIFTAVLIWKRPR